MTDNLGINFTSNDLRIIDIAPISILGTDWYCVGFEPIDLNMGDFFHLALIHNNKINKLIPSLLRGLVDSFSGQSPLLRVHSECILGDSLHSSLCDCCEQLHSSLELITDEGSGLVLYLRQEGRGIGLRAKLSCLAIQEGYIKGNLVAKKHSPDEANLALGFRVDERDYQIVPKILSIFNIASVRLITGNPEKVGAIKSDTIKVEDIVDIPRKKQLTTRQREELSEKIKRGYHYPTMEKLHANQL